MIPASKSLFQILIVRKREILDGYKQSRVTAFQKIQILRESEILFPGKKTPIQFILIADCVSFPGSNWESFAEPLGYAVFTII
jgi:hypothetical protein